MTEPGSGRSDGYFDSAPHAARTAVNNSSFATSVASFDRCLNPALLRTVCFARAVLYLAAREPNAAMLASVPAVPAAASTGCHRSLAPFPARIFPRNLTIRALRVSGDFVEFRPMT